MILAQGLGESDSNNIQLWICENKIRTVLKAYSSTKPKNYVQFFIKNSHALKDGASGCASGDIEKVIVNFLV